MILNWRTLLMITPVGLDRTRDSPFRFFIVALVIIVLNLASLPMWAGDTELVLFNFKYASSGNHPAGNLVLDAAGNLYATTERGGTYGGLCGNLGCGAILKLAPGSAGWTTSMIHRFTGGQDGADPVAGLIADSEGNLYGTASAGGTYGHGTVFKLSPLSQGWKITVLHAFRSGNDGAQPTAPLVLDAAGNLYGTTVNGGSTKGGGTVFKVSPTSNGGWRESVLYGFTGSDGVYPEGGVTLDSSGNVYGTTLGGTFGHGNVFKLSPNLTGRWTETVLYNFTGTSDGDYPFGGSLVFDSAGNLYGTTAFGGSGTGCQSWLTCGTVFKVSPNIEGGWTETVIYNFIGGADGSTPFSGLTFDVSGDLYGTTFSGGICNGNGYGCGTVFELSPNLNGGWTKTTLYRFLGGKDGANPYPGVVFDSLGNLYGTTYSGGSQCGCGTVFSLSLGTTAP
jgi:uncharacterized repeat protein (TIGR03803 family)